MKLHTRDWLDNKELRRCSPGARAILADLMCLAHEGYPYGYLTDKLGPLTEEYLASRCVVSVDKLREGITQLKAALRVHENESGALYIKRMVEDEEIRLKRAAGGSLGGNPKLTRKDNLNGNLQIHSEDNRSSRERTRADSDSVSSVLQFSPTETEAINGKGGMGGISPHPLYGRYREFVNLWPENRKGVDLGYQVWQRYVDDGTITEETIQDVFDGLERWTGSAQWAEKGGQYIPAIANMKLESPGWLQSKAWKDFPKQASGDQKWA